MSLLAPLDVIEARARALIEFADGMEEVGLASAARRSRVVARDALDLAEHLATERAARQTIQAERDRCVKLLANRAGQAAKDAA